MRLKRHARDILSAASLLLATSVVLLLDPRVRQSLALIGNRMLFYSVATWIAIAVFIKATQWQRQTKPLEFWQLTTWQLAILAFLLAILYGLAGTSIG